jgi:maltoporin
MRSGSGEQSADVGMDAASVALLTSSARNTSSTLRRQAAQLSTLDRRSKNLLAAVDELRQGIDRAMTAVSDSSAASKLVKLIDQSMP